MKHKIISNLKKWTTIRRLKKRHWRTGFPFQKYICLLKTLSTNLIKCLILHLLNSTLVFLKSGLFTFFRNAAVPFFSHFVFANSLSPFLFLTGHEKWCTFLNILVQLLNSLLSQLKLWMGRDTSIIIQGIPIMEFAEC